MPQLELAPLRTQYIQVINPDNSNSVAFRMAERPAQGQSGALTADRVANTAPNGSVQNPTIADNYAELAHQVAVEGGVRRFSADARAASAPIVPTDREVIKAHFKQQANAAACLRELANVAERRGDQGRDTVQNRLRRVGEQLTDEGVEAKMFAREYAKAGCGMATLAAITAGGSAGMIIPSLRSFYVDNSVHFGTGTIIGLGAGFVTACGSGAAGYRALSYFGDSYTHWRTSSTLAAQKRFIELCLQNHQAGDSPRARPALPAELV